MKRVMVAGKFDPAHDGHIDHICKAAKLGDELIVITHSDEVIAKVKGKCNVPLWARVAILRGLLMLYKIKGCVSVSRDSNGTVADTIRTLKPDIFAKGGDRTPSNMPQDEVEACQEVGCQIVYGVGNQLNNSSKMEVK